VPGKCAVGSVNAVGVVRQKCSALTHDRGWQTQVDIVPLAFALEVLYLVASQHVGSLL
jgi:hypothetical protein